MNTEQCLAHYFLYSNMAVYACKRQKTNEDKKFWSEFISISRDVLFSNKSQVLTFEERESICAIKQNAICEKYNKDKKQVALEFADIFENCVSKKDREKNKEVFEEIRNHANGNL